MDSSVNIAPNRSKSHDGFAPNIQETLIQRFEKSYKISIVPHALRGITLPPLLQEWGSLDQLLALCEWRAFPTPWLVMWANVISRN
jgi:hypothetical protein